MIIIYNISGLLIGALGLGLGFVVMVVMLGVGSPIFLCPGILSVAAVWCAFGRATPNLETGEMRPAPALFFIPLFYWGLVIGVLSLPIAAVEFVAGPRANGVAAGKAADNPRADQFRELERGLSRNQSDDDVLSALLTGMIAKVLPGEPVNVAIKSSDKSVLVLMKLKDLKKIKDSDRKLLLNAIHELAEAHRPGVKVYAGIKGKLLFGAISVPGQPDLVGSSVAEKTLLAFFDQPAENLEKPKSEMPDSTAAETKPQSESDSTKPADGEKQD